MISDAESGESSQEWRVSSGITIPIAGECSSCGTRIFPRPEICPTCWSTDFNDVDLLDGTAYVSSTVSIMPPGFSSPATVGYVDYSEGPRVFGHFSQHNGPVETGNRVRVDVQEVATDRDGNPITAFRFTNATQTGRK